MSAPDRAHLDAQRWTRGGSSGKGILVSHGSGEGRDERDVEEREGKGDPTHVTGMLGQCKTLSDLVSLAPHVRSFTADQVNWALRRIHELSSRAQRVGEGYTAFAAALVARGGACVRDFDVRGVAEFVYRTDK